MVAQVEDMYLDLLQTLTNCPILPPDRSITKLEYTDREHPDIFNSPHRLMSLLYNYHCYLSRFWKKLVRLVLLTLVMCVAVVTVEPSRC